MNRQTVEAPETTKRCPNCGSTALVSVGTQNIKLCTKCPTNISWYRSPGQAAVYGGTHER